MKYKILIVLFLALILIFYGFSEFDMISSHEAVHKQIFEYHGIKSEIRYDFFNFSSDAVAVTIPERNSTFKCTENCKLSHDLNDAFGYQILALQHTLWLMFVLLLTYQLITNELVIFLFT